MNAIMITGLIGEDNFAELLIGFPDEFFSMNKQVQEELWRLILMQINRGVREVEKLINFAKLWIVLYQAEKEQATPY